METFFGKTKPSQVTLERDVYWLQANATMRRTLRPTKSALAPTGNRMLDIAIRMAGTIEQQEREAAEAAAR